ncbi:phage major tail tube protein [Lysobacter arvi]|uniref:Phage major tail tube protein n=1 Tax=Lysobacter arvi TaxID=3038776 RepID=A0ABU1CB46_9GAMM|nr:phage major tail tube protein [Lysobacter arvi]MDR0182414.1 phage major tail tube protein [Lysobacter arvi]
MAMPRKLKFFNTFIDGSSYLGECVELTLPTLSRTMEDYRAGGMSGPVKVDLGQEAIELEATFGGLMRPILRQYAAARHDAVALRFAGAYQRDDNGSVQSVEIVVRGRWSEIEPGSAKGGEDTEFKSKLACSYYKLIVDGREEIEIDLLNMIERIDGVDRLAEHRRAIGA